MATATEIPPQLDPDDLDAQERGGVATDTPADDELRQINGIDEGQEKKVDKNAQKGGDGNFVFNSEDSEPLNRRQRAKSWAKKNKLWILGGGTIFGLLGLIFLLIFILGSLPLTTTAVLMERQLDRALRDTANSTEQVTNEKAAADSMDDQNSKDLASTLDKLRDSALATGFSGISVQKTMGKLVKKNFTFNYETTRSFGGIVRQRLVSISYADKTIPLAQNTTPTFQKINADYIRNRLDTASGVKNLVRQLLLEESASGGWASLWKRYILVSGSGVRAVKELIKARSYRWTTQELVDAQKSKAEADLVNQRISYDQATDSGSSISEAEQGATDDVKATVDQAAQAEKDCVASDQCLQGVVQQGGGEPSTVQDAVSKSFDPGILSKVFSKLNTAWIILAPLCAVYQNSVVNSQGVIDANSNSAMRNFYSVEAGNSQQQYSGTGGTTTVNGQAIGGYTDQMADFIHSDAYLSASGTPVDTTSTPSAQGAANGTYSFSAFSFLPPDVAGVLDHIASPLCAIFGSPWTGAVIVGGQVALNLVPGIGEVVSAGGDITAQFIARSILLQFGQALKQFLSPKQIVQFGALAGATELGSWLGKLIAAQHMAAANNGLQRKKPYLNSARMGGTIYGNEIDRRETFAAPLDSDGTKQVQSADAAFERENNSEKSPYERYLALDNPSSLLVRMATTIGAHMNPTSLSSLVTVPSKIFNFGFVSQIATMFRPQLASAIGVRDTSNYDIVQWGWTPDEESAYEDNQNYEMIHNEQVLENSGKEQEISDKYSKCFSETMGQLLASGDIRRDETTHAVLDGADQGDCSPTNLGMHNPTYGDLVFRWRVAERNDTAIKEILNMQNAVNIRA